VENILGQSPKKDLPPSFPSFIHHQGEKCIKMLWKPEGRSEVLLSLVFVHVKQCSGNKASGIGKLRSARRKHSQAAAAYFHILPVI